MNSPAATLLRPHSPLPEVIEGIRNSRNERRVHTGRLSGAATHPPSGPNLSRQQAPKAAVTAKYLVPGCTRPSLWAAAAPGRSFGIVQELRADQAASAGSHHPFRLLGPHTGRKNPGLGLHRFSCSLHVLAFLLLN